MAAACSPGLRCATDIPHTHRLSGSPQTMSGREQRACGVTCPGVQEVSARGMVPGCHCATLMVMSSTEHACHDMRTRSMPSSHRPCQRAACVDVTSLDTAHHASRTTTTATCTRLEPERRLISLLGQPRLCPCDALHCSEQCGERSLARTAA